MKKHILQTVATVSLSLIFAFVGAFYMLEKMWAIEYDRLYFLSDGFTRSLQSKVNVGTAILIVEATEDNEQERLYKFACQLLRLNIDKINIEMYSNPDRIEEVKQFVEKGKQLKHRLKKENLCYK